MERGVVFGRKEGYREEKDVFMNKPSSKEIIELLKQGKTYRDIESITGISPQKIGKVKKFLIEDGVIQINEKNRQIVRYQRKFF
jgi:DNA invertase Pin-like site-specific DNA recombinase